MGLFTVYVYLQKNCKRKLNSWSPTPHTHAMVCYLLDAWHSTTSASAEGVAFMEEDSHKRAAVGDGWH